MLRKWHLARLPGQEHNRELYMAEYILQLMESPSSIADHGFDLNFKLSRREIDDFQLHWVQSRFHPLKDKILILRKLAQEHDISAVNDLNEILPLLLGHTVYKSYPMSYLERNRFDKLTKWLAGLISIASVALFRSGKEMGMRPIRSAIVPHRWETMEDGRPDTKEGSRR